MGDALLRLLPTGPLLVPLLFLVLLWLLLLNHKAEEVLSQLECLARNQESTRPKAYLPGRVMMNMHVWSNYELGSIRRPRKSPVLFAKPRAVFSKHRGGFCMFRMQRLILLSVGLTKATKKRKVVSF